MFEEKVMWCGTCFLRKKQKGASQLYFNSDRKQKQQKSFFGFLKEAKRNFFKLFFFSPLYILG
jgi:Holliday junction resolvasome RuvABC DNA-binding subunit